MELEIVTPAWISRSNEKEVPIIEEPPMNSEMEVLLEALRETQENYRNKCTECESLWQVNEGLAEVVRKSDEALYQKTCELEQLKLRMQSLTFCEFAMDEVPLRVEPPELPKEDVVKPFKRRLKRTHKRDSSRSSKHRSSRSKREGDKNKKDADTTDRKRVTVKHLMSETQKGSDRKKDSSPKLRKKRSLRSRSEPVDMSQMRWIRVGTPTEKEAVKSNPSHLAHIYWIKPIGQTEVGMMRQCAYDTDYTGPASEATEGERLSKLFGDKTILFMANHGIATIGKSVAQAYDRLYYIERAAQVQLFAMWTGQPLKEMSSEVVDRTMKNFGGNTWGEKKPCDYHFEALKRILDRKEPDYKD